MIIDHTNFRKEATYDYEADLIEKVTKMAVRCDLG